MLRSRRFLLSLAGVVGLLLAVAGWMAWQAFQVNQDLQDAVASADRVRAAVEERDTEALQRELDDLRASSGAAADRTSGATWSLMRKMPFVGDDAEGIAVTSRVIDDLATDGIEPLVTVSDRFDELLPKEGRVNVALVRELADPVAQAARAFEEAEHDLSAQETDGFVGPLKDRFVEFRDEVASASDALGSAETATQLLPAMLGGDKERHYLLVFQNNAEIRATGGLPGAVAYLGAKRGKFTLEGQQTGGSFGEADEPALPLTDEEEALYTEVLGTWFTDANMTPDFPRAADLMRARSLKINPDQPVDGVVMIDAVAISYLLEAAGPITVDGIELTSDNVVDEMLHKVYLRYEESYLQDAFFGAAVATAFDKFTSGVGDPKVLLTSLTRAVNERRISVRSAHDNEQEAIAGTVIAGELTRPDDATAPSIFFSVNDTTGAKMSYFLRYDVDVQATSCADGVQSYDASATLSSVAPKNAAEFPYYVTGGGEYGVAPGTELVTIRIFAPTGGEIGGLVFEGEEQEFVTAEQDGRPIGIAFVQLSPGQTYDFQWTMKSGSGKTDDTVVAVTPSIEEVNNSAELPTACGSGDQS